MTILLPPEYRTPEEQARAVSLIDAACAKISRAWRKVEDYRRGEGSRWVLADLTVDSWNGIVTRLLIAKYMSWYYDARICAVLPSTSGVPYFTKAMCEAFGCKMHLGLGEAFQDALRKHPNLNVEANDLIRGWPHEGAELRDHVLALRLDGLPVGDLIYDSYLRFNGRHTIKGMDNALLGCIADAIVRKRMCDDLFEQYDVAAVNSAHVVYNYFGILTRSALSRNITVTQDLSINPIRLKKLNHFTQAVLPLGHVARREFQAILRSERETAVAYGREYMSRRIGGVQDLAYDDAVQGAYGASRRAYEREELCRQLGWDPGKPIVPILSHVFFESPHSVPDGLHHDIYQWVKETLEIGARNPHIQWLLKPHPNQEYYDNNVRHSPLLVDGQTAVQSLMQPYGHSPNIALCPTDLNTGSLMGCAHAIITSYGNAGYEFASQGIPVVLGSRAPYARLGFTIEPRTREEYASALGRLHEVGRLGEEEQALACAYIYAFFEKSRCPSSLLPDLPNQGFWAPQYETTILEGILDRADRFDPDQDPLYEAINTMLRHDTSSLNMPAM